MTEAKKDLEPVPRSVLKYDTDADSELEEGDEKGMRWERVALVFFFFFCSLCDVKGKGSSLCHRQQVHGLRVWHCDM